jgi:hypothetical protein
MRIVPYIAGLRIRRRTAFVVAGLLGLALAGATTLDLGRGTVLEQFTDNFHTVVPGEFYRSAQPSSEGVAA